MSGASTASDPAGLRMAAFCDEVALWALPEAAAPLVAAGLRADTARRLLRSPRLSGRTSALLAARIGRSEPATLGDADRRLALASPRTLDRVAILAGAVWHSARVRALVTARDIEAFVAALGEEARDAALRHAALSPTGAGRAAPADGLDAAIRRDGAACLSAWIDALPGWASGRMRLRWTGPDAEADDTPGGTGDGVPDAARGGADGMRDGAAGPLAGDAALRARAAGIVRAVQP